MDIRLNLDINFTGGLWIDNIFHMNTYSANLNLVTATLIPEDAQVAVERLRWYSYNILNNSVFVKDVETERQQKLWDCGLNVLVLPETPTDQIVGMLLYTKLNAITEEKLIVSDLQITSALSDGVRYQFDDEDNYHIFGDDGWWYDPDIVWFDKNIFKETDKNVMKIKPLMHWKDVDLHWVEDELPTSDENIVVGNFKKDD